MQLLRMEATWAILMKYSSQEGRGGPASFRRTSRLRFSKASPSDWPGGSTRSKDTAGCTPSPTQTSTIPASRRDFQSGGACRCRKTKCWDCSRGRGWADRHEPKPFSFKSLCRARVSGESSPNNPIINLQSSFSGVAGIPFHEGMHPGGTARSHRCPPVQITIRSGRSKRAPDPTRQENKP